MKAQVLGLSIFLIILPLFTKAEIGTETLPAGVRSPSVRFGMISQLDQKYSDSGTLSRTVDMRSIEFNAARLSQIAPRVKDLIQLLNNMGQFGLGSKLNLGTLRIDSKPQVQYTGLVFGYGISDRWTVGGGVPVIQYKNKINVSKTASNVKAIHQVVAGVDPAVDAGFAELENTDLVQSFHAELKRKGYSDLEDQDSTYLGDLQFASMYSLRPDFLSNDSKITSQLRVNLNLPTGPKYDSDNLAALNQFGYTYIEPQLLAASPLGSIYSMAGMLGVRYYIPDQITARVPANNNDLLPDADHKETVNRSTGLRWTEAVQLGAKLGESWSLFGISEWAQKEKDRYVGGRNSRYDLLSEGTDTQTHVVTGGITYSSVEAYKRKQKGIPAIVTAQISDTISGKNVERQLVQELSAILFF